MKPAHGFIFRQKDYTIRAYWNGKCFYSVEARAWVKNYSTKSVFLHIVTRLLLESGIQAEDAFKFVEQPVKLAPAGIN